MPYKKETPKFYEVSLKLLVCLLWFTVSSVQTCIILVELKFKGQTRVLQKDLWFKTENPQLKEKKKNTWKEKLFLTTGKICILVMQIYCYILMHPANNMHVMTL